MAEPLAERVTDEPAILALREMLPLVPERRLTGPVASRAPAMVMLPRLAVLMREKALPEEAARVTALASASETLPEVLAERLEAFVCMEVVAEPMLPVPEDSVSEAVLMVEEGS